MLVFDILRMHSFCDMSGAERSILKNKSFLDSSVKVPVKVLKLSASV